jgi:hypothetical protein
MLTAFRITAKTSNIDATLANAKTMCEVLTQVWAATHQTCSLSRAQRPVYFQPTENHPTSPIIAKLY